MRQHFPLEKRIDTTRLLQRYLLGIAQLTVGFVLDHEPILAHCLQVRAIEAGLKEVARLEFAAFGNDWRGRFVTPAHSFVDGLLLGCAELVTLSFQGSIEAGTEFIVVIEHGAT